MKVKNKARLLVVMSVCIFIILVLTTSSAFGKSINILFSEHPTIEVLDKDLSEFTEKTGIELNIDRMPENGAIKRGALALSSGSGEFDVIMSFGNRASMFSAAGWIEPLDGFIAKETEDSFDFNDLLSKLMPVLTNEGKVYGLPFTAETNILYYNKEIFSEVGLDGPPNSLEEMIEYASIIKSGGYDGIALRGEAYASVFPWVMFRKIYGIEAFLDENFQPTFDTKESIEATKKWANMLQNYGPDGIAQYGWLEVKLDFQQGKVGMVMDTSMWGPDFENPEKSNVAGKVGYAHIPGPGELYNVTSCWAFYIASDSKNKEEAWEFIKWATSKDLQLKQALRGERTNASRKSVWENEKVGSIYGAKWLQATNKSLAHADPFYYPIIPEISEIRTKLGNRLSAILSNQETAEDALGQAADEAKKILESAGY